MEIWKCPVCGKQLLKEDRCYKCSESHQFDIAKQGYINLLQSQVSKSKQHGDEKEMVRARQEFLEKGYYGIFRETLGNLLNLDEGSVLVDAGCGEGYYAEAFSDKHQVFGIDISKDAVVKAAKRNKNIKTAVASTYSFPILSECVDLVYSVFAPYSIDEIYRVLKQGAYFIETFPLEQHLYEMKEVLYEKPYPNQEIIKEYDGFDCVDVRRVEDIADLENQVDIQNLFKMTPYYHRTPDHGIRALSELERLRTQIGFGFAVYKKR